MCFDLCFGEDIGRSKEDQDQHELIDQRRQHEELAKRHRKNQKELERQDTELMKARKLNLWLTDRVRDLENRRAGNSSHTVTSTQTDLALGPQRRGTA
jgi:hypothetical protein